MFRKIISENMTSAAKWMIEKEKILKLPLNEKRCLYNVKEYFTLELIETWDDYVRKCPKIESKKHTLDDLTEFKKIRIDNTKNKKLAEKTSVFTGDITSLEIDAIVNAANTRLKAGAGVDGAIHKAAGPLLQEECNSLQGCPTGAAKITGGYNLPANYVIHTVGPQDGSQLKLKSCYDNCFNLQKKHELRSIAFPCISTGIYGFPNRLAAHIALQAARMAMEADEKIKRVIFCTFTNVDVDIYETLMQMYFPVHEWNYNDGAFTTE